MKRSVRSAEESRVRARLARCVAGALTLVVVGVPASAAAVVAASEPLTTPAAELDQLGSVSLAPSDLAPTLTILSYPGGTAVSGQVSLDLCGGSYASERSRTGRLQVAVVPAATPDVDAQLASVEAISYGDEPAALQAMLELATAAQNCPRSSFVPSAVRGMPPMNWHFNRAPDTTWKKVAGVQRLAFDVTLTDQEGRTGRQHLIYLRRGRVIVGIYGTARTLDKVAAPSLKGEPGLVNTIAKRLAAMREQVTES
jgi:hypothetical protein